MVDISTSSKIVFVPVDFDPFGGLTIEKLAPSTESQKEIWASCMIGGADANRAYNESITLNFKGCLDESALEKALEALINRNDSLRTVFSADGKQLCIFDKQPVNLYYKDLSEIPDSVAERIVQKYIKDDALFIFSLTDGPLLKTGLFKINYHEYKFVLTTHHIICDGWSIGILLQELSKLYSSYTQNVPIELPTAPLFSEYAFKHTQFIDSGDYQAQEEFWLKNLKQNTPVVNLPIDFDRPPVRTYKSGRNDYAVDQELILQLKKIGVENGCSLVITLTAAFELFLHRLTGHDDLMLGLPAADQSASGNLRLIGHCVNLLPLRSKQDPTLRFSEFLKERRAFMFDAYENQQVTFGSLLKKLTISRDTSRVPLIPIVFNIDMGLTDGVKFHDLDFDFFNNPREYESFELFVNATGSEESFILEWSYNTQLFKPESIKKMMAGFNTVLKTLVANPNVILHDALERDNITTRLLQSEQKKLVIDFNTSHFEYPSDKNKTIIDLFSEQEKRNPGSVALIDEDFTVSYSELDEQSNRLANYLQNQGVKEGTLVPVCIERSAGLIVAILAVLKAGGAYVPLDPAYPRDRISYMLEDCGAEIVVSSKLSSSKIKNGSALTIIETDGADKASISNTSAAASFNSLSPESLAYIIYTSGSTGRPKGVEITHKNAGSFINWCRQEFSSSSFEIVYFTTSICFDLSIFEIFYPLSIGKSFRILENGLAVTKYLTNDSEVLLNTVPSVVASLLADKADLGNVSVLNMAGEPIPLQIVQNLDTDRMEVRNLYGPTEDTTYSTVYRLRKDEPILIGKPITGTQIYIVNPQNQICPTGFSGELCIGGDGLAKGYLNRTDLTAEKFVCNPFNNEEGARMYKTGDLARWLPDGNIEYLGRIDDQVKIRGYRIEPGEIEQLLIKQKNIKQVLVIAREDRAGDKRLVAYIVTKSIVSEEDFQDSIKVWKQVVKSQLPIYMCPADYVSLRSIPLNLNGKIDRAKLPKPAESGKTAPDFTAPRTETEKLVANNWAHFLGIKKISIHDDFFELGGHSMLAIEALAQLAKKVGKILPVSTLLENPTIFKLAELLDKGLAVDRWKSLVAMKTSGNKNPLYLIHGAGLGVWAFTDVISHLDEEQPVYAFQGLGIDGLDEPFETLDETVAFYISELMQQNSTGPYLLAGFSDGGLIAFEMARQLKSMGKQVAMLGLFDTCIKEPVSRSIVEKIILKLKYTAYEIKSLFLHPQKAIKYHRKLLEIRLINIAQRFGYRPKDDFRETYPDLYAAMGKYALSLSKYRRRPYDGVIDLFKAKVRVYYVDDFEYLGWKPYTSEDVIIHQVPGDHDDMILPENAPAFARILQKAIDKKS
ncbi:MAG TPA: amino acid adenylation domain-containing protein [Pedobacter sp.]